MARVTVFGEILMRLSTRNAKLFRHSNDFLVHFGGSEANVAVNLVQMGVSAGITSAVPNHKISEYALSVFKGYGVDTRHVRKRESGRMGLYFLEQGAALRGSQIIYDRASSSFSELKPGDFNWDNMFDDTEWFHVSGISAAVSYDAAKVCIEAAECAKAKGLKVSVDLNYRKNLWKYGKQPDQVMPDIVRHADVLLGDPATINKMMGTSLPTKEYYASGKDLLESYSRLSDTYSNLNYTAMTLRAVKSANHNIIGGALYHQGVMYDAKSYDVTPIVERIGGGDAFMAGIIYGLITDKKPEYVVDFATAVSALKMTVEGDFCSFSMDEIEACMVNDSAGVIKR